MKPSNEKDSSRSFWQAFWEGLAAPGMIEPTPAITRIHLPRVSSRDALRSDWERIGGDFSRVIAREQEHLG
ncbi:MAG: hypothetical protein LBB76_05650 [Azoarcus sp.]|jgi:hypothetical protein|nr:hypothetical protein [Azoarcus sp.]